MIGGNWYWGVLENVAGLMQCSTRSANTLYLYMPVRLGAKKCVANNVQWNGSSTPTLVDVRCGGSKPWNILKLLP